MKCMYLQNLSILQEIFTISRPGVLTSITTTGYSVDQKTELMSSLWQISHVFLAFFRETYSAYDLRSPSENIPHSQTKALV